MNIFCSLRSLITALPWCGNKSWTASMLHQQKHWKRKFTAAEREQFQGNRRSQLHLCLTDFLLQSSHGNYRQPCVKSLIYLKSLQLVTLGSQDANEGDPTSYKNELILAHRWQSKKYFSEIGNISPDIHYTLLFWHIDICFCMLRLNYRGKPRDFHLNYLYQHVKWNLLWDK